MKPWVPRLAAVAALLSGGPALSLPPAQALSEPERIEREASSDDEAPTSDDASKESLVDPRLRAALEAEGFNYTVGHGGDLEVLIDFSEEGRSQFVRLQSSVRRYRDIDYRDVYSTAYRFDPEAGLDPALARRLLDDNNDYTLGFWAVQDEVVFSIARIPAHASPAMVREAISFVAAEADDLEKELIGSDEL